MLKFIIDHVSKEYGIDKELASRLVTFIDTQKLKGFTRAEAFSKYGDILGFLRIADTSVSNALFNERWADHRVWIKVTKDLEHFLNNDTPIFTPPRLEPVIDAKPYYKAGIPQVETGVIYDPITGGSVRKAPPMEEDYSSFIVNEYLPTHFHIEVLNSDLPSIVTNGLPESTYANPRIIHPSFTDARTHLSRDLILKGAQAVTHAMLLKYTLIKVLTDKMEINNDVFYTKVLHGHRTGSRAMGYYYVAHVEPGAISISKENISK